MFGNSVFFIYNENREFYQTMEHGPQDIQNNDNLTLFAFALATAIVSAATAGLIIGFYKVCKWSFTFARLIKDYVLTALLVRQARVEMHHEAACMKNRCSALACELYDKLRTTYPQAQKAVYLSQDGALHKASIEHPLVMFAEQMTKYFACVHQAASGQLFSVTELEDSWMNAQACLTCMETQHEGLYFQAGKEALFADTRKVLLELESYVLCDIAQRNKRNLYQLAANQSYQSS